MPNRSHFNLPKSSLSQPSRRTIHALGNRAPYDGRGYRPDNRPSYTLFRRMVLVRNSQKDVRISELAHRPARLGRYTAGRPRRNIWTKSARAATPTVRMKPFG